MAKKPEYKPLIKDDLSDLKSNVANKPFDYKGTKGTKNYSISRSKHLGGQTIEDFRKSTGTGVSMLTPDNLSNRSYFEEVINDKETLRNDIKAYEQSTWDKVGNGIMKFAGRAGTSIIGSTIGTFYGLYAWARDGEFKSFYDNEFQHGLDGINDYIREEFPHYYTSDPDDWEIGNFWFDKVFDGLGFATGAVASGMLGGGAVNVLGKVGKAMKLGKLAKYKAVKNLKNLQASGASTAEIGIARANIDKVGASMSRLSKVPHDIAALTTGAVYESGFEGRMVFKDTKERLIEQYKAETGYAPTGKELEEINKIAGESANGVFAANMALVGGSTYAQFGKHLGLSFPQMKNLIKPRIAKEIVEEGSKKYVKKGSSIVRGTATIAKKPFVESQEEMLQSVFSKTGEEYAMAKYNNNGKASVSDLAKAAITSAKKVYTSKEGWEEGLIGAIIGSIGVYSGAKSETGGRELPLPAVIKSIGEARNEEQLRNMIVDGINNNEIASTLTSTAEYMIRDGKLERTKDLALVEGDEHIYNNAKDEQLFSYFDSRMKAGMFASVQEDIQGLRSMPVEKYKELVGIPEEVEFTETDKSQLINSYERKIKEYKEAHDFIEKNYKEYDEDAKTALRYNLATLKRIEARQRNISEQIDKLTEGSFAQEISTLRKAGARPGADEFFGEVDSKIKTIHKENLTNLYDDYFKLEDRANDILKEYDKTVRDPQGLEEKIEKAVTELEKELNKDSDEIEKTNRKENQVKQGIEDNETKKQQNKLKEAEQAVIDQTEDEAFEAAYRDLEERESNEKIINDKITNLKDRQSKLLNEQSALDNTLNFLDEILQTNSEYSSKEVEGLLKQINTLKGLLSNNLAKTKRGKATIATIEELENQIRNEFSLGHDILNRVRELREESIQLEAILKDLNNQISYYQNLIANSNMTTLSQNELKKQLRKVESKASTVRKLIDAIKNAISKSLAYLNEYIGIWNKTYNKLENFKDKNNFKPLSQSELKEIIEKDDVQSQEWLNKYTELAQRYAGLEEQVLAQMTDIEFLEEVKAKEGDRLNELIEALRKYDNQARYLKELIDSYDAAIKESPISTPQGTPQGPAPVNTKGTQQHTEARVGNAEATKTPAKTAGLDQETINGLVAAINDAKDLTALAKVANFINELKQEESLDEMPDAIKEAYQAKRDELKNKLVPKTKTEEDSEVDEPHEMNEAPRDFSDEEAKQAAEKLKDANQGEQDGTDNNDPIIRDNGIVYLRKRLVDAWNAIAVRTRNFVENVAKGEINESEDELSSLTTLDILSSKFINRGDKVQISLHYGELFDPQGNPLEIKNEEGPNQIMKIEKDGQLIGYLHDLSYIRPDRVVEATEQYPDNLARNREELEQTRKDLYKALSTNNNTPITAVVGGKSAGTINIKTNQKYDTPLSQAIEKDDRPKILVVKSGGLYLGTSNVEDMDLGEQIHTPSAEFLEEYAGMTLVALPTANGGYSTVFARNPKLKDVKINDESVTDIIKEVVTSYLTSDYATLEQYGLADAEAKEMYAEDIEQYLKNFMHMSSIVFVDGTTDHNNHFFYIGKNDYGPVIQFVHEGSQINLHKKSDLSVLEAKLDGALLNTNLNMLNPNRVNEVRLKDGTKVNYDTFIKDNLMVNFFGEEVHMKHNNKKEMVYVSNPVITINKPNFIEEKAPVIEEGSEFFFEDDSPLADIERRRQEALENITQFEDVDGNGLFKDGSWGTIFAEEDRMTITEAIELGLAETDTREELVDNINAKYDAEIAALGKETTPVEEVEIAEAKENISEDSPEATGQPLSKEETTLPPKKDNPLDKLEDSFSPKREYTNSDLRKGLNTIVDDKGVINASKHNRDITNTITAVMVSLLENKPGITVGEIMSVIDEAFNDKFDIYNYFGSQTSIDEDLATERNALLTVEDNAEMARRYKLVLDNMPIFKQLALAKLKTYGYSVNANTGSLEYVQEDTTDIEEKIEAESEEMISGGEAENARTSYDEGEVLRKDPVESMSARVRHLLSTIKTGEKNFLNKPQYHDMYHVYYSILDILANTNNETLDKSIIELERNIKSKPYLQEVVNMLRSEKIEMHDKLEFHSVIKKALLVHETVLVEPKEQGTDIKVINTNRNTLAQQIAEDWVVNQEGVSMWKDQNGISVLNKDYINTTLQDKWVAVIEAGRKDKESSEKTRYAVKALQSYLKAVGIYMSEEALMYLEDNPSYLTGNPNTQFASLFSTKKSGVFSEINNRLKEATKDTEEHPLETEGYIKKLATLQAEFSEDVSTHSFINSEKNNIFSFINSSWMIERLSRLKHKRKGIRKKMINRLLALPFSKHSNWLKELGPNANEKFRDHFNITLLDTLKQAKEDGASFSSLSEREQLVAQLNLFVNNEQGTKDQKISKFIVAKADKHLLHVVTALRHMMDSSNAEINKGEFGTNDKNALLDLVKSEYSRILDAQEKRKNGIDFTDLAYKTDSEGNITHGYNPFQFYFFEGLNDKSNKQVAKLYHNGELKTWEELTSSGLIDTVLWEVVKTQFNNEAAKLRKELISKNIIIPKDPDVEDSQDMIRSGLKYNKSANYFVRDYLLNYMIANVNYAQIFQGDPAVGFKKSIDGTFANLFKRLAKDIAPATRGGKLKLSALRKLTGGTNYNKYNQIVLRDSYGNSLNIQELMAKQIPGYEGMDTSVDAQEVTTLEEHLNIMYHYGKIKTKQYLNLLKKAQKGQELTQEELDIVLQPMKPVHSGNYIMNEYGVDMPIYIKSSSFPLVPQLLGENSPWAQLEKTMRKKNVQRAVFQSGIKLGAFKIIDGWNKMTNPKTEELMGTTSEDGKFTPFTNGTFNIKEIEAQIDNGAFMTLNRDNFGIQQDMPYDPFKSKILEGSQLVKLIMNGLDTSTPYGAKVRDRFNELHNELTDIGFENFLDKIGFEEVGGKISPKNGSLEKFKNVIIQELITRGDYNQNDYLALELNKEGTDFLTPLWANPKSAKFEAVLNSLISKNVLRQKMPGKSYILATEEGWTHKDVTIEKVPKSKLKGSAYKAGEGLKPQRTGYKNESTGQVMEVDNFNKLVEEGTIKATDFVEVVLPAQILIAKPKKKVIIEDADGNRISMATYNRLSEIEKSDYTVNTLRFENPQMVGYRIPTQDLNSMSAMEVVGYLPDYMGDIIIAPKDFTVQMGSDFDIDKLYVHRWNESDSGKPIDETTAKRAWDYQKKSSDNSEMAAKLEAAGLEIPEDTESFEEFKKKFQKEVIQNKIMDEYWKILTDPSNLSDILKPLDFGNLPEVVKTINREQESEERAHILSPTRQIENYQNGNAGKFGVAATSLVSTFNATAQSITEELELMEEVAIYEKGVYKGSKIVPRFFNFNIDGEPKPLSKINNTKETANGKTTKAAVISAYQSAAVDNINELLINTLNYNKHTHDAFTALAMLGLDEDYIGYLLAQPIIKRFVKLNENAKDMFAVQGESAYTELFDELSDMIGNPEVERAIFTGGWNDAYSTEDLKNSLNSKDPIYSLKILVKFYKLSNAGRDINSLIRATQPATSGIGKNRINSELKELSANSAITSKAIRNADAIFGTVEVKESEPGRNQDLQVNVEGTTIIGKGVQVMKKANDIYGNYFHINKLGTKLANMIKFLKNDTELNFTEKQYEDFISFAKSYLFSAELQMYGNEEAVAYRERLLFGNESLAHRWNKFKKDIPKHWLAKRIRVRITLGSKKPNTIRYNAAQSERSDDLENVITLIEMLESNDPTQIELAEDTIAYTYLRGGKQDALSLLKFIPNRYLQVTKMGADITEKFKETYTGEDLSASLLEQYLQHKPFYAYNPTTQFINGDFLKRLEVEVRPNGKATIQYMGRTYKMFDTEAEAELTLARLQQIEKGTIEIQKSELESEYIPKYTYGKYKGKMTLYKLDNNSAKSDAVVYRPMDRLGSSEFMETQYRQLNATSSILENQVDPEDTAETQEPTKVDLPPSSNRQNVRDNVQNNVKDTSSLATKFKLPQGSQSATRVDSVIDDIIDSMANPQLKNVLKFLKPLLGTTTIKVGRPSRDDVDGEYSSTYDVIIIDNKITSEETFARVLVHEMVHAVLDKAIVSPTAAQQKHVDALKNLFKEFKSQYKGNIPNAKLNLKEFVAEIMTDADFQVELDNMRFGKDKTFLQRFLEIVSEILNSAKSLLAADVNTVGVTAQAMSEIVRLTNAGNQTTVSTDTAAIIKASENVEISESIETEETVTLDDIPTEDDVVVNEDHMIFKSRDTKLDYTEDQKIALGKLGRFIDSKDSGNFFLLAGYAGTGKTTLVENILKYGETTKNDVRITATTNNAVDVLKNKFKGSKKKFSTIHKLIGLVPSEVEGKEDQIYDKIPNGSIVVIDEASMLDKKLLDLVVMQAKVGNAKVIFVGDSFQLEPVGEDPKLFSEFDFGDNKYELSEVKRQDGDILKVATHIRTVKRNELLDINSKEFAVVEQAQIKEEIDNDIANNNDFVVLVTTNKDKIKKNNYIRAKKYGKELAGEHKILKGEKLMFISTNVSSNGSLYTLPNNVEIEKVIPFTYKEKSYEGHLVSIPGTKKKIFVVPNYEGPSLYGSQLTKIEELAPIMQKKTSNFGTEYYKWNKEIDIANYGYASTIHKSQGNEWDNVYITANYMAQGWDAARMIYTAVTRGKNKVRVQNTSVINIKEDLSMYEENLPDPTPEMLSPSPFISKSPKRGIKPAKNGIFTEMSNEDLEEFKKQCNG